MNLDRVPRYSRVQLFPGATPQGLRSVRPPMKALHAWFVSLLASGISLFAQEASPTDRITLGNGDILSGTIKTMADGEIVLTTAALGDVKVKLADVKDIVTGKPIVLLTKNGEKIERRVTSIQNGQLQLAEGPAGAPVVGTIAVASLDKLNPPEKPPAKWEGNVTFGGYLLTGNTDRRGATGDFTAVRRSEMDRLNTNAFWEYAEDKDQATRDWKLQQRRTGMQLKYDYFLSKKSYLWVNTAAEGNYTANLDLRFTVGAGYGYQWIETEKTKFGTELGLAFASEDYRGPAPTHQYLAARVAWKLEHQITERLKFWQQLEAFPSTENVRDFYGKLDSRLIAKLTDSFVAQAKVVLDYDNTPATGREGLDVGYFLTLGWTF